MFFRMICAVSLILITYSSIDSLSAANSSVLAEARALLKQENLQEQIKRTELTLKIHAENNPQVLTMFHETLSQWHDYFIANEGNFDLPLLLKAISFAAIKHNGQYRKDTTKTPYIIHPISVARSLWEEGHVRSINVLAVAIIHDILKDTDTSKEEIALLFGQGICHTIEELTNDPGRLVV